MSTSEEVRLDGKAPLRALLHDWDVHGDYSWGPMAIDVDGDGLFTPPELIHVGETAAVGEHLLTLVAVDPGGRHAELRVARRTPGDRHRDIVEELARAPLVGNPLPELRATDLDGEVVTTTSLRGDVVLLSFWGEGSRLEELDGEYREAGLRVISIVEEDEHGLRRVARERCATWPVVVPRSPTTSPGTGTGSPDGPRSSSWGATVGSSRGTWSFVVTGPSPRRGS